MLGARFTCGTARLSDGSVVATARLDEFGRPAGLIEVGRGTSGSPLVILARGVRYNSRNSMLKETPGEFETLCRFRGLIASDWQPGGHRAFPKHTVQLRLARRRPRHVLWRQHYGTARIYGGRRRICFDQVPRMAGALSQRRSGRRQG